MGGQLIPSLLARGHRVRALTRPESVGRLTPGAVPIVGNALDVGSFVSAVQPGDTFVHLVGTPQPSPAKAQEFQKVDLPSVHAAIAAARHAAVAHFIYVSVAQPAPVMKAYVEVRAEGERAIREAGLTATVLRPWYVLGPGHRWPKLLVPAYALARLVPSWRAGSERLGLVTLPQMVRALTLALEDPPPAATMRVVEVPEIRSS
jgi:uncharacterized protein YbjT (DUF2867 family)